MWRVVCIDGAITAIFYRTCEFAFIGQDRLCNRHPGEWPLPFWRVLQTYNIALMIRNFFRITVDFILILLFQTLILKLENHFWKIQKGDFQSFSCEYNSYFIFIQFSIIYLWFYLQILFIELEILGVLGIRLRYCLLMIWRLILILNFFI